MKTYTKPQTAIVQVQAESMLLSGSSQSVSIEKHDEYFQEDESY